MSLKTLYCRWFFSSLFGMFTMPYFYSYPYSYPYISLSTAKHCPPKARMKAL